MNEKIKEIIDKHKADFDEEVRNFKARTLVKLISQEELFEIIKHIIDDYESETESSSDNESDNTPDPTELNPDDIDFDYSSATTQRFRMLIEDLMNTIIHEINYNAITDELSMVFKTYNIAKYDSLENRIKHILYENNSEPDILHHINVLLRTLATRIYHIIQGKIFNIL